MWWADGHMSHSEKLILWISLWLLEGSAYAGPPRLWTCEVANFLDSIKHVGGILIQWPYGYGVGQSSHVFGLIRYHGPYRFVKTKCHQQEIPENTEKSKLREGYLHPKTRIMPLFLVLSIGDGLKIHPMHVFHREEWAATPPQLHILWMPVPLFVPSPRTPEALLVSVFPAFMTMPSFLVTMWDGKA